MSMRSLLILAGVSVVLVLGALAIQAGRAGGQKGAGLPDRVLPALEARVNDVASVRIEKASASLTLSREDGEWVVDDLAHYPARVEDVKRLVLALGELEPLEPKTSRADRYAAIGVEGPTDGSESYRVTLADAGGAELASIIVGSSDFFGDEQGTYVRASGDDQAWLAKGAINAPDEVMRWVDRSVVRIAGERLRRARFEHPDGEVVELARSGDAIDAPFVVENAPDGRQSKPEAELNAFVNALSYVSMEDAQEAPQAPADAVLAVYTLDDGSTLRARTWEDDDSRFWVVFEASDATEADDPDSAEGPGESADPEQPGDPASVLPSAAEALAGRSAWAFVIPASKAERLRARLVDVTDVVDRPEEVGPLLDPNAPAGG